MIVLRLQAYERILYDWCSIQSERWSKSFWYFMLHQTPHPPRTAPFRVRFRARARLFLTPGISSPQKFFPIGNFKNPFGVENFKIPIGFQNSVETKCPEYENLAKGTGTPLSREKGQSLGGGGSLVYRSHLKNRIRIKF